MAQALAATEIAEIKTNVDFLKQVIGCSAFERGRMSTTFIERNRADLLAL